MLALIFCYFLADDYLKPWSDSRSDRNPTIARTGDSANTSHPLDAGGPVTHHKPDPEAPLDTPPRIHPPQSKLEPALPVSSPVIDYSTVPPSVDSTASHRHVTAVDNSIHPPTRPAQPKDDDLSHVFPHANDSSPLKAQSPSRILHSARRKRRLDLKGDIQLFLSSFCCQYLFPAIQGLKRSKTDLEFASKGLSRPESSLRSYLGHVRSVSEPTMGVTNRNPSSAQALLFDCVEGPTHREILTWQCQNAASVPSEDYHLWEVPLSTQGVRQFTQELDFG